MSSYITNRRRARVVLHRRYSPGCYLIVRKITVSSALKASLDQAHWYDSRERIRFQAYVDHLMQDPVFNALELYHIGVFSRDDYNYYYYSS